MILGWFLYEIKAMLAMFGMVFVDVLGMFWACVRGCVGDVSGMFWA